MLFVSSIIISQEKEEGKYPQDINKKHELKLSPTSLIILSSFDISYEYLINEYSSFGVSLFYNFNNPNDDFYFLKKFSLTPYYRWFFSEKRATRGFFVEAFSMLNNYKDEYYYDYDNIDGDYYYNTKTKKQTDFALGISVGGKFVTKKGFVAEVFLGVGRNLFNKDNSVLDTSIIGRGGISLGYRF